MRPCTTKQAIPKLDKTVSRKRLADRSSCEYIATETTIERDEVSALDGTITIPKSRNQEN